MGIFQRARGLTRGSVLAIVAGTLVLAGCDSRIELGERAADKSDPCVQYREVIVQARETDIQRQQNAAVAGAVIGGILGGMVSSRSDRTQGILAGAALGGLAGLSATYYQQKAERAADSRSLLASVNSDARNEQALVTRTGQAAQALRTCRRNQVAALTKQVRAGQVDKSTARVRLRNIQTRLNTDNRLITASFQGITERVTAYNDATAQVARADRAISAQGARASTPNVVRVSTASNQTIRTDQRNRAQIDSEIAALEVLLG